MLGGGLGRLQGLHGLTSDSVRNVRLALWNGTIIDASEEVNQDLFYGVRGLGQNYGIIIETTYETYPATSGGNYYNADMIFNKSATEGIMNVINNFATPALDPKAGFITFFALNTTTSEVSQRVNSTFIPH
jgi:FAD/FMN-containing dehydrogenase